MTKDEKALLKKAYERLNIADVYLLETAADMDEGFLPHRFPRNDLAFQYRQMVDEPRLSVVPGIDGGEIKLWRFFVRVGARFITVNDTHSPDESVKDQMAEITAVFVAEYEQDCDTEIPLDALNAFGQDNALFHVWPYWREYLQNTCLRMKLPPVTLPMLIMRAKKEQKAPETE